MLLIVFCDVSTGCLDCEKCYFVDGYNISDLFLNAENLMALMNRCDTKIAVQILYFISESNIFNILYNGK